MFQVIPFTLECIRTRSGEQTEEPYLCLYADENLVFRWGPTPMRDGDSQRLYTTDLVGRQVGILLSEADPGRDGDDHIGGLEFREPPGAFAFFGFGLFTEWRRARWRKRLARLGFPATGYYNILLPFHEGSYGWAERRYRLHYGLRASLEENLPSYPYLLRLLSIECVNAQEYADRVWLKVDGQEVWTPHRMRSEQILSLESLDEVPIHYGSILSLWEQDRSSDDNIGRNDLFGEHTFRIGADFAFDTELPLSFTADRGITDDAHYRIRYRVGQA